MRRNIKFDITKGTPSCFIVTSTFQLLCAIEAIHEFKIYEYKFIFALKKEWGERNYQMAEMARKWNYQYDLVWIDNSNLSMESADSWYREGESNKKYGYVFIGDYYAIELKVLALKYANRIAKILYLDDGISTLRILKQLEKVESINWVAAIRFHKQQKKQNAAIQKELLDKYGIIDSHAFFTIFADIPAPKGITTYMNTLQYVKAKTLNNFFERESCVYVIGTVINQFAELGGLSTAEFEGVISENLSLIKMRYPSSKIVYIPHGRDTNQLVKSLCEQFKIQYLPINETCETFILRKGEPIAVYGYCSTALITLKRLFPTIEIFNYYINRKYRNQRYSHMRNVCDYYRHNGIINLPIATSSITIYGEIRMLYNNLMSVFNVIARKIKRNRI